MINIADLGNVTFVIAGCYISLEIVQLPLFTTYWLFHFTRLEEEIF